MSVFQTSLGGPPKPYNTPYTRSSLDIGRVVRVWPESHSVDVMLLAGGLLEKVQLMSGFAGVGFGNSGLPALAETKSPLPEGDDAPMWAIVGYLGHVTRPVCLGFLYPEVTQMLFSERGLHISRHESGIYNLLDTAGNYELAFPDGTFLKVGYSAEKRDLEGKDFDGKWHIPAADPVQVTLAHSSGAKVVISPTGEITLTATKVAIASDNIELVGPGGKAVVRDGDSCSCGGVVNASSSKVKVGD